MLVRRLLVGVLAAWSLLSVLFLSLMLTDDWELGAELAAAGREGADEEQLERIRAEYLAERGLDRPLYEQYVDWVVEMFTLRWGRSFETGEPVRSMVADAAVNTGTYVLPAIVLSVPIALGVGVYVAMVHGSPGADALRSAVYVALGLPNFWIGALVLVVSGAVTFQFQRLATRITPAELPVFYETVVPTLLLTTTLVAAITSYARSYAMSYVGADLTKLVRAKGGGRLAVARHVVRNAAIPLVSLAFTEILALLALSVFVIEVLFGIGGLGLLFYNAIWAHDVPVVLGGTMIVVAVGVAGSAAQDVAYSALDPRVDTGTR